MGRAGQEYELVRQWAQSFCQAVALGNRFARYFAQVMGLVKDNHIPRLRVGCCEQRQMAFRFGAVDGHNHLVIVMSSPLVGARNAEILSIDAESFIELVLHLVLPLLHHPGRAHNQHSPGFPTSLFGCQQQSNFYGFAQPYIIGDKPVIPVGGHYSVHQIDLMRQRVHIKAVQRAGDLIPRVQRIGQRL